LKGGEGMTGKEYLWTYCQLKLHGYSHEEAEKIIEEIKEKMKEDEK
jgi:hypothetical protein